MPLKNIVVDNLCLNITYYTKFVKMKYPFIKTKPRPNGAGLRYYPTLL